MTNTFTRSGLIAHGAKGAVALGIGGAFLATTVEKAVAAPIPTGDLAYTRLLVGAELLGIDFYTQAIAAGIAGPRIQKFLKRAAFNEQQHYDSVSGILTGSG